MCNTILIRGIRNSVLMLDLFLVMNLQQIQKNEILRLSFNFSLSVIAYVQKLKDSRQFEIANQLMRSGTAICANLIEAQNSESKNDFIHKCKIAGKEADETEYWLLLCQHTPGLPSFETMLDEIRSLNKIINAIITTSKKRPT